MTQVWLTRFHTGCIHIQSSWLAVLLTSAMYLHSVWLFPLRHLRPSEHLLPLPSHSQDPVECPFSSSLDLGLSQHISSPNGGPCTTLQYVYTISVCPPHPVASSLTLREVVLVYLSPFPLLQHPGAYPDLRPWLISLLQSKYWIAPFLHFTSEPHHVRLGFAKCTSLREQFHWALHINLSRVLLDRSHHIQVTSSRFITDKLASRNKKSLGTIVSSCKSHKS
jgi:hypothetical protein